MLPSGGPTTITMKRIKGEGMRRAETDKKENLDSHLLIWQSEHCTSCVARGRGEYKLAIERMMMTPNEQF